MINKEIYQYSTNDQKENLASAIIGAALEVHRILGCGLRREIYIDCLAYELEQRGFYVQRNAVESIVYKEKVIESGVVLELLVDNEIPVLCVNSEAIEELQVIDLLNQMKHSELTLGLIINFNVKHIRGAAIRRVKNGFS
jgi:GxxExxY protein